MSEPTQDKESKVQMTNPPTQATKMVAAESTVKVRILRDCKVGDRMFKENDLVDLPRSDARELINFKVTGMYAFSGEREGDEKLATIRKAELYKEPVSEETI